MTLLERADQLTVASALANRATVDPERPYLRFEDQVLSFGEVDTRAEALAASLYELGVRPGDPMAILLPACPEFAIAFYAAAKLRAVAVPLNPRLTAPELRFALQHAKVTCAITVESLHDRDYIQMFEDLLVQLDDLKNLITVGNEDVWYDDRIYPFEDILSAGKGRNFAAPPDSPSDSAALIYTRGTTGKPKAVEVSHANLISVASRTVAAVGMTPDDVVVGVTSLFHVFGIGPGLLGSLLAGSSLVLQKEFDAAETLDLAERHRATVHYGVPPLFAAELAELERRPRQLSTLRTGIVTGGEAADSLLVEIRTALTPDLRVAYSLTEASGPVTMTGVEEEMGRFTVGRPLPGTEVKILGPDGSELPVESVGEVAVRGPGVMKGYHRQPRETASQLSEERFLRTGDMGMVDEAGFLHLVGRRREVIIRAGYSVHPLEVEERLQAHPAVDTVAVVGVPDAKLGEASCAWVVPVEGAILGRAELRDWCALTLAAYKVPDAVQFVEELPTSGTGKVLRSELARRAEATLSNSLTEDA